MYRESLLGIALGATLAELSDTHALSESQKEQLWAVFDRCMDACLAEVPRQSRVMIRVPGPAASSSVSLPPLRTHNGASSPPPPLLLTTLDQDDNDNDDDKASARQRQRQHDDDDEGHDAVVRDAAALTYPLYRCADGVWTILLKDPVLDVRDEFGVTERLHLDYLKVYLKDTTHRHGGGSGSRGSRGGVKATRRRRAAAATAMTAASSSSGGDGGVRTRRTTSARY